MRYTITIVDMGTREPLAGSITFYNGLDPAGESMSVSASGITVDINGLLTQLKVNSSGYYSYITTADTLYDRTEIQLEKKPAIWGYVAVGIAVGFFGSRLIKNFKS